jgi:hypothetical protein
MSQLQNVPILNILSLGHYVFAGFVIDMFSSLGSFVSGRFMGVPLFWLPVPGCNYSNVLEMLEGASIKLNNGSILIKIYKGEKLHAIITKKK